MNFLYIKGKIKYLSAKEAAALQRRPLNKTIWKVCYKILSTKITKQINKRDTFFFSSSLHKHGGMWGVECLVGTAEARRTHHGFTFPLAFIIKVCFSDSHRP